MELMTCIRAFNFLKVGFYAQGRNSIKRGMKQKGGQYRKEGRCRRRVL